MDYKQVLFLDIDEVLNNRKTVFLFGYGYEITDKDDVKKFDHVALSIIRKIVEHAKADVVISSSWRIGNDTPQDFAKGLQLPVIDFTPSLTGPRGLEIDYWLNEHPEYMNYVILDDNSDMLEKQLPHFVQTSGIDGFMWQNALDIAEKFGFNIYDIPRPRGAWEL